MKPKSITWFEILAWASVGLSTLGVLIILIFLLDAGRYAPTSAYLLLIALPLAILGAMAVLIFQIARKRSAVARGLYVALVGLLILLGIVGLIGGEGQSNVLGILLTILQFGLLIGSVIFLFQRDTNAWLGQSGFAFGGHGGHGGGYPQPGYPPQQQPGGSWGAPPPPPYGGGYPGAGGGYPPAGGQQAYGQPQTGYPPAPQPAPEPAAAQSGATRACPYCAEQIRAEAMKCRFCGSEVEPLTR